MKLKIINILILQILALSFAVYATISFARREIITKESKPITQFQIIGKDCGSGYRGGSTVEILYNQRKYYVGITAKQCKESNLRTLPYYYDSVSDIVFTKDNLRLRIVIFSYIIFILSFGLWFLLKHHPYSK